MYYSPSSLATEHQDLIIFQRVHNDVSVSSNGQFITVNLEEDQFHVIWVDKSNSQAFPDMTGRLGELETQPLFVPVAAQTERAGGRGHDH